MASYSRLEFVSVSVLDEFYLEMEMCWSSLSLVERAGSGVWFHG